MADTGAGREAGCVAGIGLVVFPLLVWGFVARFGMDAADALFLSVVLGLLPALAVAQVPLAEEVEVDRLEAYRGSAVMLAVLGGGATFLGWTEPGVDAMGLARPDPGTFALWTGVLAAAAAALQAFFLWAGRRFDWPESDLLKHLLPRTGEEKRAFAGVSLVAGFGEEIAFRGFAIPVLAPVVGGVWPAAVFTSVTFGLLHAYQGPVGIVRTALFGLVLAASFLASGTLWPAIVVHLAVDLVVGVWLGERWLEARSADTSHSPPRDG